jgi:hypothetical protein
MPRMEDGGDMDEESGETQPAPEAPAPEAPAPEAPEPSPIADDPAEGLGLDWENKGDPPGAETLEDAIEGLRIEREG